jgi:hypothetical protein
VDQLTNNADSDTGLPRLSYQPHDVHGSNSKVGIPGATKYRCGHESCREGIVGFNVDGRGVGYPVLV